MLPQGLTAVCGCVSGDVGSTALMVACESGHVEGVAWLLQQGARMDARDRQGRTAIVRAIRVSGR